MATGRPPRSASEPALIFTASAGGKTARVEVRRKDGRFAVTLDGLPIDVDFRPASPHFAHALIGTESHDVGFEKCLGGYSVVFRDVTVEVQLADATHGDSGVVKKGAHGPAKVQAPMPGKVVRVLVLPNQEVTAGQGLLVMEAMKMENELRAPRAGIVREIKAVEGQAVETGALLVIVE